MSRRLGVKQATMFGMAVNRLLYTLPDGWGLDIGWVREPNTTKPFVAATAYPPPGGAAVLGYGTGLTVASATEAVLDLIDRLEGKGRG